LDYIPRPSTRAVVAAAATGSATATALAAATIVGRGSWSVLVASERTQAVACFDVKTDCISSDSDFRLPSTMRGFRTSCSPCWTKMGNFEVGGS